MYSHLIYDIVPGDQHIVTHRTFSFSKVSTLQTGPTLMVSDLFDFSVYVDARIEDIEQWYINRFLAMRAGAFADPASHFHHYASLSDQQAIAAARDIWRTINRPNLIENILPSRPRQPSCCAGTPITHQSAPAAQALNAPQPQVRAAKRTLDRRSAAMRAAAFCQLCRERCGTSVTNHCQAWRATGSSPAAVAFCA